MYYYTYMADRSKRSYNSPLRDRAAQQTRDLLCETARGRFVEQGYAATTMRQIAAEAGVAERTLYLAFPTKGALLNEVIGSAIALNLLFGLPMIWGVCLTSLDVLLVLVLQSRGFRTIEAIVAALIATVVALVQLR